MSPPRTLPCNDGYVKMNTTVALFVVEKMELTQKSISTGLVNYIMLYPHNRKLWKN